MMILAFAVLWPAIAATGPVPNGEAQSVSIYRLLTAPREFDGKRVRVSGYCWLEFEGQALYPHEEDRVQGISANGVWLGLSRPDAEEAQPAVSGRYVVVEGTFDSGSRGHFGAYAASLRDITYLRALPLAAPGHLRAPSVATAVAPSYPDGFCEEGALVFQVTVAANGRVTGFGSVDGGPEALRAQANELKKVAARWRYSSDPGRADVTTDIVFGFHVAAAGASADDLLPVFHGDTVDVSRAPCRP